MTTRASVGRERVRLMQWALVSPIDSLKPEHSSGDKLATPGHTSHCQLDFQIKSLFILRGFMFQALQHCTLCPAFEFCSSLLLRFRGGYPHLLVTHPPGSA